MGALSHELRDIQTQLRDLFKYLDEELYPKIDGIAGQLRNLDVRITKFEGRLTGIEQQLTELLGRGR